MKQKQFHPENLIKKLNRIEREIKEVREALQDGYVKVKEGRPYCEKCGTMNLRARMDKTYFCNTCGFDSRPIFKNVQKTSQEDKDE